MLINPYNFEELIAPITPKEFFKEYWEKKPLLLIDRKAQGYKDLINIKEVESLLFSRPVLTDDKLPSLRFVHEHKMLKLDDFISNERGILKGFLNKSKVLSFYRKGMNINLITPDEYFEPLHRLCREIERVIGHPNDTEVFLTPPNSKGFKAHYDRHNVFVLQIDGTKHWDIFDVVVPFPLVATDQPYRGALPEPIHRIVLKPGDLIYLPRGYVHQTYTTNDRSLSVSLGVNSLTWVDLMQEILKSEPEFRRSLPIDAFFSHNSEKIDLKAFEKILKELLNDREKIEFAFRKIKGKVAKKKRYTSNDSFDVNHPPITDTTLFKKREGMICSIVTEGEETTIHFGEDEVNGPSYIEPVLNHIVEKDSFSIKTLPNCLKDSGKLVLIKSLIDSGLLERADTPKKLAKTSKKR